MTMRVGLYVVIVKIESSQSLHVGNGSCRSDLESISGFPAATVDFGPRSRGQLRQRFIRLAAHGDITLQFAQRRGRRRGTVGTDGDLYCFALQRGEPLLRNTQLGWRTAPEQIRRRGRNDKKIGSEPVELMPDVLHRQLIDVGVNQNRFVIGGTDLIECE